MTLIWQSLAAVGTLTLLLLGLRALGHLFEWMGNLIDAVRSYREYKPRCDELEQRLEFLRQLRRDLEAENAELRAKLQGGPYR